MQFGRTDNDSRYDNSLYKGDSSVKRQHQNRIQVFESANSGYQKWEDVNQ